MGSEEKVRKLVGIFLKVKELVTKLSQKKEKVKRDKDTMSLHLPVDPLKSRNDEFSF